MAEDFSLTDRENGSAGASRWGLDGTLRGGPETPPPAYNSNDEAESQTKTDRRGSWLRRLFSSSSRSDSNEEAERDISDTDVRCLEECQEGYPRLAAFKACEPSFSLYRGFSYVHSRLILDLQAKIAALENELDDLDEEEFEDEDKRIRLSSVKEDIEAARTASPDQRHRQHILEELRVNVLHYDELLIKAKQLAAFQRPNNRDYCSVRAYFWNFRPLAKKEEKYIKCREDLVSLRNGREWAGFDQWVETSLLKLSRKIPFIKKAFCPPDLKRKTEDEDIRYLSPSRIEKFVGLIITAIVFVLLVLPVIGMYRLASFGDTKDIFAAIGVMIVFTLLFAAAMSLLTKARRHELFAASAAYCAILVVFITNV
ncbi:hypothetical protein GTA08_BOTSDO04345 [Botryosphaeria dothidea]|uniref:DUF6594 domain-containing protein n=1 Tax=Botryosphaeria dothidea TaxID=55169 RepID=A0A8H4IVY5_9PEZI|nr:hypothetical protein GTA08_BOTSDO04345 [Botryosphaeria dothidea]